MRIDLKFVELTADVLEIYFPTIDPSHYEKTLPNSILQVPTTQLAKRSIDPKFVKLTADILEIFLSNICSCHRYLKCIREPAMSFQSLVLEFITLNV